jgi:diguanylate cyclase (GGDEF)-like protein
MRHFKRLSITDDLTGLMNYRGLRTNIDKIIHSNPVFTLALIDLDNFKSFNKHGYSLGDEVLQEFISFLKKTVADYMIIVRFRIGDEFIIILKNTDQLAAEQQISDVKTKCWNYPFKCLETFSEKHLSFSSGIVQYSAEYNTLEKLIREADIRLKKV